MTRRKPWARSRSWDCSLWSEHAQKLFLPHAVFGTLGRQRMWPWLMQAEMAHVFHHFICTLMLHCLDTTQIQRMGIRQSNPPAQVSRAPEMLNCWNILHYGISILLFLQFYLFSSSCSALDSRFYLHASLLSHRFLGGFMMASQLLIAFPSMQLGAFWLYGVYPKYWLKYGAYPNFQCLFYWRYPAFHRIRAIQLTFWDDAGMSEAPANHLTVSLPESVNIAAW